MSEDQYPDLFGEASGHAWREAKQTAYAVAVFAGVYLRRHAREEQRKALRGEQERRAAAQREQAEREAVRSRWEPACDRQWLRSAGPVELAETWGAAVPYADPSTDLYEQSAELAADNCESRLRDLHPYAMSRYDRLRTDGVSRSDAMREAGPLFLNHPNTRPHGTDPRLGISVRGLGHPWADEVHGPSREGFERHVAEQQTARGSRILDGMQSRALASDRPLLDADEQRTALEAVTNLPPQVIDQVVGQPSAPIRRPWENDSPFSIEEVVALAARHPEALASPAATAQVARRRPEQAPHA